MDRGVWWVKVHGLQRSPWGWKRVKITEQLNHQRTWDGLMWKSTSYVSSDLKNRRQKFWQAQMQKWDGEIRAIENNFVKNEHKYFCFKSWHESRKVFQKYRNENSHPNFIVFNFLKNFFVKIQLYHSSYNIFTSSLSSHTVVITPTRKPSLGNSGMFSLLEFSDDFEYLSQWL